MKKQEYLDKLELELRRQNIIQVEEIMADYREHFEVAAGKGKNEEEIVEKLGEPTTIAKAYQAENLIRQMEDAPVRDQFSFVVRAVLRLIILTPLNFLILVGPVLIVCVVTFVLWTTVISLGFAGVGICFKMLATISALSLGFWGMAMSFFAGISILCQALLGIIIMFFITRFILQMFIRYLQWNIQFVKGEA